MRILVVGVTGVLGRALVSVLEGAGHEVHGFSRHASGPRRTAADLLTADLEPLVRGCDAVIHAATAIPRDRSVPGAWDLNTRLRTEGTRRLLAAAGARRYVQQSIVMAYADGGDTLLDESSPFDSNPARSSVVEPVREMERLVQASESDWVILRGGSFVPVAVTPIACDGRYWISPIHPMDMATAVLRALASQTSREVFNITAEPIRYEDYAARFNAPRAPDRSCPPSHRCTNAHAQSVLGWHPTHSIWPEGH